MGYRKLYLLKASLSVLVLLVFLILVSISFFEWPGVDMQRSFGAPLMFSQKELHQASSSPNQPLDTPSATPTLVCGPYFEAVYSPNAGPGNNYVNGVTAISANDMWAVGYYADVTTFN